MRLGSKPLENMIVSHIKASLRNLYKNRVFSTINLLGLSVGMGCFILIIAYVFNEKSYDRYHDNADRIYRIVENMRTDNQDFLQATTSPPMGPTFLREFPEVQNYVRFSNWLLDSYIVRINEKIFKETECYHADSSIFDVFSYRLIKGNPKKALVDPYSMVIDEKTAIKYFGSSDPIGQIVELNKESYKVTGVMEEVPQNSHFRFNVLLSMTSFIKNKEWENNAWGFNAFYTYILLTDNDEAPENLRYKIPAYIEKYISKFSNQYKTYYTDLPIQPLLSIYTETPLTWENGKRGSKSNITILTGIAVLVLLIACFNYINLATALVGRRLKEVGLRKTLGALRGQLVAQYLAESSLLSLFALGLGILFAVSARPTINSIMDQSIALNFYGDDIPFWLSMTGGAIAIGIISGIYPALILSRLQPIQLYNNQTHSMSGNKLLRKGLVSLQFFISISLIGCAFAFLRQLNFIRSTDLGFKKDLTLVVDFAGAKPSTSYQAITDALRNLNGVTSVAGSSTVPGDAIDNSFCLVEKNPGTMSETSINVMNVDREFLPGYNIQTIYGKTFSDFASDSSNRFIINEAAASHFGWNPPESAIGKGVDLQGKKGSIIGVVGDFYYKSLHAKVEPLIIYGTEQGLQKLSIKISPTSNVTSLIDALDTKWKKLTDLPFSYGFLDQSVDLAYKGEIQLGRFVSLFSGLAIFVACLGLVGLVSFSIERRAKEFSIRKLLGLSDLGVGVLISREFLTLVFISFIFAMPVTYYVINLWLTNFILRAAIGISPFMTAFVSVFVLSSCVVLFFTIRASRINPADNLRKE